MNKVYLTLKMCTMCIKLYISYVSQKVICIPISVIRNGSHQVLLVQKFLPQKICSSVFFFYAYGLQSKDHTTGMFLILKVSVKGKIFV